MSAHPKLPKTLRMEIMQTVQKRRDLVRKIAELQDEKRRLPNNKTIARRLGVCYAVVRRTLHGDPYKTRHPQDDLEAA